MFKTRDSDRVAQQPEHHRLPLWFLAFFLLLSFFLYALIAKGLFGEYPFSMDEYNYLYQAQIYASGSLYIETDASHRPFFENYMLFNNGRLFSKYPPATSLLFSLGVVLGEPALVNPLLSCLTLLLVFLLIRARLGDEIALMATALMATSPYFVGYAASFFAQPLALFLTTLSLYLVFEARRGRPGRDVFVGVVLGVLCFVRPLDAFCASLVVAFVLYRRNGGVKYILKNLRWALPLLLGVCSLLAFNYYLSGVYSVATYPVLDREFTLQGKNPISFLDNLKLVSQEYANNFLLYTWPNFAEQFLRRAVYFVPLLALVGFASQRNLFSNALLLSFLSLLLLSNFHSYFGWSQYGARYFYSAFGGVICLAAQGLVYVRQRYFGGKKLVFWGFYAALLFMQVIFLYADLLEYRKRFELAHFVNQEIDTVCPAKSLVILKKPNCYVDLIPYWIKWVDFKRNPFFKNERMFVLSADDIKTAKRQTQGRPICEFKFSATCGEIKAWKQAGQQ